MEKSIKTGKDDKNELVGEDDEAAKLQEGSVEKVHTITVSNKEDSPSNLGKDKFETSKETGKDDKNERR